MTREEMIKFIQDNTMESAEVLEYLDINKQRLSALNKLGKLVSVRRGIYLKQDVEARKKEAADLREKYSKK